MHNAFSLKSKSFYISIFCLILIPVLLYSKVLTYDFVNWDDDLYVYENSSISSFHQENIRAWFFKPFVSLYTPMTLVTYALDYRLSGNQPASYHRTNLFLHLFNGFLLFLILISLFQNWFGCFLGALLFLIHPAQAESVAWISERKTLLFGLFFLSGIFCWIRHKRVSKTPVLLVGAIVLMIFAVLSKITAVTMPVIAWCYHRFYRQKSNSLASKKLLTFALLFSTILGGLTLLLYPSILYYLSTKSLPDIILNMARAWLLYLKIALFPVNLSLFYSLDSSWIRSIPITLLAICSCLGLTFLLIWSWIQKKTWGFGLFLFVCSLVPVASFIPVPINNRHLYIPLTGLIIALLELSKKHPRFSVSILTLGLMMSLAFLPAQISPWKNSRSLWTNALTQHPDNNIALSLMANAEINSGHIPEAKELYRKIIQIYPTDWKAYISLINLEIKSGQKENARKIVDEAKNKFPNHNIASILKMAWLLSQNKFNDVIALGKSLNEKSYWPAAVDQYMALAYFNQDLFEPSIQHFERAIKAGITPPDFIFQAAIANMNVKRWEDSLNYLQQIESLNPAIPGLFFQIGYCHYQLNDIEKAVFYYAKSMRLHPQFPFAYDHYGLMLMSQNRATEALAYFKKAVALSPNSAVFNNHLEAAQHAIATS